MPNREDAGLLLVLHISRANFSSSENVSIRLNPRSNKSAFAIGDAGDEGLLEDSIWSGFTAGCEDLSGG